MSLIRTSFLHHPQDSRQTDCIRPRLRLQHRNLAQCMACGLYFHVECVVDLVRGYPYGTSLKRYINGLNWASLPIEIDA
ncbi:MAG: hypothetical protein C0492_02995 [Verminephrobacter sp.]|nr:hypothetical protein [Verminephrobacter sp.]